MHSSTPDAAALGRAVQAIRAERGISQIQLAEATGFMQSWISNVEHGRRNVSWSNVGRLAEGLGVSVSELAARAEAISESPGAST
ncbi:MAG TPA: helix-turn-helix transcriptional regulator [Solirubrobacteraceae bacterium]|jgi:transcriptional regulator with XRE-family HTH domain|nr:helix-turn-helix transcriptional regulator [Solirubrobacteraceae bacterium]